MFGLFKQTPVALGGYLWKNPWRLSALRKYRHRKRLQNVDEVVSTVSEALNTNNQSCKLLRVIEEGLPRESEMSPKDKYSVFTKTTRGKGIQGWRKSIHKVPKWTKITHRTNPLGF
ncbi:mitochondrial 54S ribosomal protein YmL31 [Schizosaccharomyces japonicus yFS275]|uniref:Large ribosomal subunit protein mL60 n=1 Tax=Schizosaccharomyces japonicus (strain yFS275 / FY16936) TaxID=402676 RepID=B6K688_SCHJY|nr:mitochondrial 54S ribosomal protein YmL31 [Schizosaccharomyces japonicus yFS275]EEB09042.1 ribosomal protein subunit L31 [Schizosaccharomyces japonicus yFS275]